MTMQQTGNEEHPPELEKSIVQILSKEKPYIPTLILDKNDMEDAALEAALDTALREI